MKRSEMFGAAILVFGNFACSYRCLFNPFLNLQDFSITMYRINKIITYLTCVIVAAIQPIAAVLSRTNVMQLN